MIESTRQIFKLIASSKKLWLLPVFLLLIIVALLVISAQIAPVPIFLYPLI